MRNTYTALAVFMLAVAAVAQSPGTGLTFDVASVRVHPAGPSTAPLGFRGGPGTNDPGQWTCTGCQLTTLFLQGYNVTFNRIVGPDWIRTERYDVAVKIPAGTTKEQFAIMLQNLLKDRFHLAAHHESREEAVYDLLIARGGSKLQNAAPANPADGPFRVSAVDANGFPDLPAGRPFTMTRFAAGRNLLAMRMKPIADLALMIEGVVGRPVVDKTGLTGMYDLKLEFAQGLSADATQDGAAPIIFDAVEKQLGLKLESARGPVDHFVVEHVERVPTEN
jgi:uncharacterized protein (TIGR03435 family)